MTCDVQTRLETFARITGERVLDVRLKALQNVHDEAFNATMKNVTFRQVPWVW
jgi:hypothetical protein